MVTVIHPDDPMPIGVDFTKSIFLAGPCPRGDDTFDWRDKAINILNNMCFDGFVFTPTHRVKHSGDDFSLKSQVDWETKYLNECEVIVFWINRTEKQPALTTNIEFGEWFKDKKSIIGWPDDAIKNNYLQVRLDNIGKVRYDNLIELLRAAKLRIDRAVLSEDYIDKLITDYVDSCQCPRYDYLNTDRLSKFLKGRLLKIDYFQKWKKRLPDYSDVGNEEE